MLLYSVSEKQLMPLIFKIGANVFLELENNYVTGTANRTWLNVSKKSSIQVSAVLIILARLECILTFATK